MKRVDREWMYERVDDRNMVKYEFVIGVNSFIEYAKTQVQFSNSQLIRCPCVRCKNMKYLSEFVVHEHLINKGFTGNYYEWVCHGEPFSSTIPNNESDPHTSTRRPYRDMVIDGLGDTVLEFMEEPHITEEESPNPELKSFFDMLEAAEMPLYKGSDVTVLEAASRLINIKCEENLSHKCIDKFASFLEDVIPRDNKMTRSFYNTKKLLKALQLPHKKIHCCRGGCMLFWKEDVLLEKCKKCGKDRYKPKTASGKSIPHKFLIYLPLGPRLQRLYATRNIAEAMTWHDQNPRVQGTFAHPSDSEAWKHLDKMFPEFASEPRNVRLGLCTDGFTPYGQFGKPYSCWPVVLTPYNLPPWLCMKKPFMLLSLIVPGPKNPKKNLDVYLQPLIEELKELWEVGTPAFDVSKKQNFQLKAALLWTINDFPAYGMLSGWATAGKLACPYCREESKAFWLDNGNKVCWFDCHRQFLSANHGFRYNKNSFLKKKFQKHDEPPPILDGFEIWEKIRDYPTVVDGTDAEFKELKKMKNGWFKRSIFWDLPYWKHLLIRHNLDVMHIEKNFFEQLIHTVMDNKKKTADNHNSRKDLVNLCNRSHLHIMENGEKPLAPFALDKTKRKVLCEWLCNLRFPDGYASDLSRCVDLNNLTLHGLKSHDCHVFMERLLPVALKHLLPKEEWNAITEISLFFRDLCAPTLKLENIENLENNIAEILCKLERVFPPSFFNSMEHLPIHLPYEARVGGPVQYRWMYPFERFLNHLKQKVGNKARVEGSICNAFLVEEISNFCSLYFEEHIDTKSKDLDFGTRDETDSTLPELFQKHGGKTFTKGKIRYLDGDEYDRAHLYALSNCELLENYERLFEAFIREKHPHVNNDEDVWSSFEKLYPMWFKEHVRDNNIKDDLLVALANGPSKETKTWHRYSINGYNFHTLKYGKNKASMNYGVCVNGIDGDDYYGTLEEIIELRYCGEKMVYNAIMFKCCWMDNSANGTIVHDIYKLVEVNHKRKYAKYDPFVLAHQVNQVYYAPYPNTKKDRDHWLAVFKSKARSQIDAPVQTTVFQEEVTTPLNLSSIVENDPIQGLNEVSDDDEEEEEGDVRILKRRKNDMYEKDIDDFLDDNDEDEDEDVEEEEEGDDEYGDGDGDSDGDDEVEDDDDEEEEE